MLSRSNPRGYDDRSLVSARVSKLARWRPLLMPLNAVGGLASELFPESIWNGKDPRPDDAVENCDAVDIPSVRLFGGAGRSESESSRFCVLGNSARLGVVAGEPPKDCWPRGDTGGDRIGLSDMGDGGTKGKDSRIESARVDAADMTEELEILRLGSPP